MHPNVVRTFPASSERKQQSFSLKCSLCTDSCKDEGHEVNYITWARWLV
jgi:hypothetical protein